MISNCRREAMAKATKASPATTSKPSTPYVTADIAMLAYVPAEKRAALEKMYATSHMAIPSLGGKRAD